MPLLAALVSVALIVESRELACQQQVRSTGLLSWRLLVLQVLWKYLVWQMSC